MMILEYDKTSLKNAHYFKYLSTFHLCPLDEREISVKDDSHHSMGTFFRIPNESIFYWNANENRSDIRQTKVSTGQKSAEEMKKLSSFKGSMHNKRHFHEWIDIRKCFKERKEIFRRLFALVLNDKAFSKVFFAK